MKVYISGPITGLSQEVVERNFNKAIDAVLKIYPQAQIINPFIICQKMPFTDWKDFMQICLKMLGECEIIYMAEGWAKSFGCLTEYYFAAGCKNIRIVLYDEEEVCL